MEKKFGYQRMPEFHFLTRTFNRAALASVGSLERGLAMAKTCGDNEMTFS